MTAVLLALAVWSWGMAHRPPRRRPDDDHPPHQRGNDEVRLPRRPGTDWARFLDTVAARVRGGTSLRTAFADAQRDHPVQGSAIRADARLDDLGTAHTTDPDEAVVVQVLSTAARLGGATAATVQAGASILRERRGAREEAAAHGAQARLSARVLTLVPLVFAAWSFAASASFRRALATPAGMGAVLAGLGCNLVGWWWMRRIVRGAVP
jgi:Flp pilus assembly protein TadB